MNANIILDGVSAILNQLIANAVADAVKPLEERITVLQAAYTDWTAMEHVAAKAVQPMLNRLTSLEINQTLVSSAKINLADLVAELVGAYDYIKRNEVVDLVDTVVENAIEAYDFSESFDFENAIENYDFREIVEGSMPEDDEAMTQDKVQEMINDSLDNLTISRN